MDFLYASFLEVFMAKRLCLSRNNKIIAGVCGGLAEYFGWDVNIVRILAVAATLMGFSGLIIYVIAWLVLPACDTE